MLKKKKKERERNTWPQWNGGKQLLSNIIQEHASQKSNRYWTDGQNTALSCTTTRPVEIHQYWTVHQYWASWESLHSLRQGDQCRENQADDNQHQWHQHRDQSKWTEAWDRHKLQVPGLTYNWWGFQARDTLQDSTDNSSIDKVETSLEWQEYFSQFQDTTDALLCHIHLPVCLWIMDPHSRAPKKNTSHGQQLRHAHARSP